MILNSSRIRIITQSFITCAAQVEKPDGGTDYFIKWESLPYSEASVEDGNIINKKWPKKVQEYKEREESKRTPNKSCRALKVRPKFFQIKNQPSFVGGDSVSPEFPPPPPGFDLL